MALMPAIRQLTRSNPPTVGDEYFNTTANLLKRWNGTTWQASDINTTNLADSSGSSLVGYQSAGTGAVPTTVQEALRLQAINPKNYGAIGDGVADDTEAINKTFAIGGVINVADGDYLIDPSQTIPPANGSTIIFSAGARFVSKPIVNDYYELIDLTGCVNVSIWNPVLVGDKDSHLGTTGQWGHGINAVNCTGCRIYYPNITKCWGDGIYIRGATDLKIYDPVLDQNRRQGMSVASVNGLRVYNPVFSNTSGQNPAYGLDCELNWAGENTIDAKFYNPVFKNNGIGGSYRAGFALATARANLADGGGAVPNTTIEIEMIRPRFYGDAAVITAVHDTVYGYMKMFEPEFHLSVLTSLYLLNHRSANFKTEILNPKFFGAVSGGTTAITDNPITFETNDGNTSAGSRNIVIRDPEIYSSGFPRTFAVRSITAVGYLNDLSGVEILGLKTVGYSNPLTLNNGTATPNTPSTSFVVTHSEFGDYTTVSTGSNITGLLDRSKSIYSEATASSVFYLNDEIPVSGAEFIFVNNGTGVNGTLTLNFGTSSTPSPKYVNGLSPSEAISGIVLHKVGGWVRLKKVAADRFAIVDSNLNIVPAPYVLQKTISWNPPSLAAGAVQSTSGTMTGAYVGMPVNMAFDQPLLGTRMWAEITATNTVTVYHHNPTASPVDVAAGIVTVFQVQKT